MAFSLSAYSVADFQFVGFFVGGGVNAIVLTNNVYYILKTIFQSTVCVYIDKQNYTSELLFAQYFYRVIAHYAVVLSMCQFICL